MVTFNKLCAAALVLMVGSSCICAEDKKIQDLDWHGDLRLRTETINVPNGGNTLRERFRLRIGTSAQINPQLKAVIGFASGGTSGRSTEQTLGEVGTGGSATVRGPQQYDLRLARAYLEYSPTDNITITYGKAKNPIWGVSEFLWDADINIDGVGFNYAPSGSGFFFNAAGLVFQELEKSNVTGVKAFVVQPGFQFAAGKSFHRVALGYYKFDNLKGSSLGNGTESSGSNNTLQSSVLKYNYDVFTLTGESRYPGLFGFQVVRLYADSVYNPDPQQANYGAIFGLSFGDRRVQDAGQWQFDINYRVLLEDAFVDILPEGSFYNGKTGVKGLRFAHYYGLAKNTSLTNTFFFAENTITREGQTVFQTDVKVDF